MPATISRPDWSEAPRPGAPATHGRVDLVFARSGRRTVLVRQYAAAPLHVQGILGQCAPDDPTTEVVLLNVAGGVVAGDLLEQVVTAGPGATVRVLTAGATRLYRAKADDAVPACVYITLRAAPGALVEYLPDETIPYAGAIYEQRVNVELARGGRAIVGEVIGPGRLHRGEVFAYRRLCLRLRADLNGRPVLRDKLVLEPTTWPPNHRAILGLYTHLATLSYIGVDPDAETSLVAALRLLIARHEIYGGVTIGYGEVVVLRAVGHSAYSLLHLLRDAAALCRTQAPVPSEERR